jgi:hypothetical protein
MKGDYEELHAFKAAKKQSQTKPIYSYCVLRAAYCVIDLSFLWKQESRIANSFGFRIECGMTGLVAFFIRQFEKTKPICGWAKLAQSLI